MSKSKAQFINPKDVGLPVVGGRGPIFDDEALARADQTMEAMSASFQQWIDADVIRLHEARLSAERAAWSDLALDQVLGVAHDIKGMGTSYGYPLATQIAASLCRLIETPAGKAAARGEPALILAHVDALRALVRGQIKTREHPVGSALLAALDGEVERLGVAPR